MLLSWGSVCGGRERQRAWGCGGQDPALRACMPTSPSRPPPPPFVWGSWMFEIVANGRNGIDVDKASTGGGGGGGGGGVACARWCSACSWAHTGGLASLPCRLGCHPLAGALASLPGPPPTPPPTFTTTHSFHPSPPHSTVRLFAAGCLLLRREERGGPQAHHAVCQGVVVGLCVCV